VVHPGAGRAARRPGARAAGRARPGRAGTGRRLRPRRIPGRSRRPPQHRLPQPGRSRALPGQRLPQPGRSRALPRHGLSRPDQRLRRRWDTRSGHARGPRRQCRVRRPAGRRPCRRGRLRPGARHDRPPVVGAGCPSRTAPSRVCRPAVRGFRGTSRARSGSRASPGATAWSGSAAWSHARAERNPASGRARRSTVLRNGAARRVLVAAARRSARPPAAAAGPGPAVPPGHVPRIRSALGRYAAPACLERTAVFWLTPVAW
jgi:hypothetical protein